MAPRLRLVSSDRFDAKVNLTINNAAVTRCYIWRNSHTGLDSSLRALNAIVYNIKTVKRNKFYYAFLGVSFDESFQRIQHLRWLLAIVSLLYTVYLAIALQFDTPSLLYIMNSCYGVITLSTWLSHALSQDCPSQARSQGVRGVWLNPLPIVIIVINNLMLSRDT